MTQTKHTPGPWVTFGWKDGLTFGIQQKRRDGMKMLKSILNDKTFNKENEEDCANARLIASAPCLLEALKEAKTLLELLYEKPELIESQTAEETAFLIDEAISKAEGHS